MSLAVVTDSAACLTEPLLRERAIEVVPLHAIPADNGEAATTSRPSVQELVDAYRRAASRAEEVLAIHISSALSGTMDNARIAAAQLACGVPTAAAVIIDVPGTWADLEPKGARIREIFTARKRD